MRQSEAPIGTLAIIGHPANQRLIFRSGLGWVHVHDLSAVDEEDFLAGWDVVTLVAPRVGQRWNVTAGRLLPDERQVVEVITPNGDQIRMYREGGLWFFEDGHMYAYFTPPFWREVT